MKFLRSLPEALYYISDRGILLWIEVYHEYIIEYSKYIATLRELDGVISVQAILFDEYRGSRSPIDIFGKLEYRKDGFANSSTDVDLTRYLDGL